MLEITPVQYSSRLANAGLECGCLDAAGWGKERLREIIARVNFLPPRVP